MRYQTKVFLFLFFFFSLSVFGVHYFSFALLTIIRTTKNQGTQNSTASNINKITFISSCRNQDERRENKREIEEGRRGENGSWDWGEDLISLCSLFFGITFLQVKICWNKEKKYWASLNKNLIFWSISKTKIHWHSSCGSQNI